MPTPCPPTSPSPAALRLDHQLCFALYSASLAMTKLYKPLLDGLDDYVPALEVVKIPDATHWIVHEQPQRVIAEIAAFIERTQ